MDADVVAGLLRIATRRILLEEKVFLSEGVASKRPATASGCGGARPSAASPLLPNAPRHRLRRGSLHPTPRRSPLAHRRQTPGSRERRLPPAVTRLTPFFSTLLAS